MTRRARAPRIPNSAMGRQLVAWDLFLRNFPRNWGLPLSEKLSASPAAATQLFSWTLGAKDAERKEFLEGAPRNVAKARIRLGLEQCRLQPGPGDEFLPAVSDAALLGNTSSPALGLAWNTFGNPSAPKREAQDAPPDAPEPKLPRTNEAAESERGFAVYASSRCGVSGGTGCCGRIQSAIAWGWSGTDWRPLYSTQWVTQPWRPGAPFLWPGIIKAWYQSMQPYGAPLNGTRVCRGGTCGRY